MASVAVDGEKKKATYGKVILTLQNCIIPQEKLSPTPSEIDGLDREIETELRILGCELIQTSGILLRLPQVAMATGQVLFQRFYYSKSFVRHTMEAVAAACITLASKIEEAPRRIRDVLNVVHHIKQVRMGKTIQPLILDQNYINLKNQVIKAERRILKELGFCVHVQHPHKNNAIPASVTLAPDPKHCQFLLCHLRTAVIWLPESLFWQRHLHDISENNDLTTIILNLSQIIVTLLKVLNVNNIKLTQTAWNYMNDSLRSEVFVLYCPETIACACIYLSARVLQIPLPNKPAWYLIFNVTEEDIHKICLHILSLYSNKKPDSDKLEKIVAEVNKIHQEAKLKAKGLASMNALLANHHSSFSPTSTPVSPKDSKSPNSDAKKDKFESKNNGISPKGSRDNNHRKRRSVSPNADGMNSPHRKKKSKISSSGGSLSSRSPSPRRKNQKTPPRGFKDSHRSRSRSKTRELKKSKRKSSHKVKKENRSLSISPSLSPHKHSSNKKSYKSKSSKSRHASRSPARNHEHNHHTNSHEKSHKSRNREKNKSSHHSKDKSRR